MKRDLHGKFTASLLACPSELAQMYGEMSSMMLFDWINFQWEKWVNFRWEFSGSKSVIS